MIENNINFTTNEDEDENWISKSSIKRHGKYLRNIGYTLINLSEAEIKRIKFDNNEIIQAIQVGKKLKENSEELRRQLLYIESLLRHDDNFSKYEKSLLAISSNSLSNNVQTHKIEQLRKKLIENGIKGINELTSQYPHVDRQKLRTLVTNSQKEITDNKEKKSYKDLFQFLKNLIEE
ncbi:MAG: ribosome biogenesis factor YjgA [Succinivibrionaceae bacterium]